MEILHEKSETNPSGFQTEHFFKIGDWVHIAYTWDIKHGKNFL